ncbi:MAG: efflux RND transporter periplasmic adaptor subunit [Bacteroidales bacterium]
MAAYRFETGIVSVSKLIVSVLLITGCSSNQRPNFQDIATPVSVVELTKSPITKYITTSGTALAQGEVELKSEMAGVYELQKNPGTGRVYMLGDKVKKGAVIAVLSDPEYVNSVAIESKRLAYELATQEQTKQKALYEKGGVTLNDMKNSEVKVTNAKYDLENAELKLAKMQIVAPIDGIIVDLPHYTSNTRIEQGKLIASLMDYEQLYLDINLPENTIGYVKMQQPANITHYTLKKDTLKAEVTQLSPAINKETRTYKGKMEIRNEGLKIRPGMFVKADIVVDRADSVIVIPKKVIQTAQNDKYVFVVEKNVAVRKNIRTGLEEEDKIEVVDGLKVNDNLIVRGFETLRDRSNVKVER